jgi:DNA adenine methylase
MARSPIKWYGGKFYLKNWILKHIPPHHTYVEVFGGAGHILFAKKKSPIEVYNDLNEDLIVMFQVFLDKEKRKGLYNLIRSVPFDKAYIKNLQREFHERRFHNDIHRVFLFLVCIYMGYGGKPYSKGVGFSINNYKSLLYLPSRVEGLINRVKDVIFENLDFKDVIMKYDTKDTFFYIDPPYIIQGKKQNDYYGGKNGGVIMDNALHYDLVNILLELKGKVILSGYDNEIYKALENNGWVKLTRKYKVSAFTKPGQKRKEVVECLWLNFPPKERTLWGTLLSEKVKEQNTT